MVEFAAAFIKKFLNFFNYGVNGYDWFGQQTPSNTTFHSSISFSLFTPFPFNLIWLKKERKVKQWLASLRRGKERKWSKDGGAEINKVDWSEVQLR